LDIFLQAKPTLISNNFWKYALFLWQISESFC
jgi:hypothetical protein